jgi:uncharacterized protein involved in exopolysaccharide biosynthesis
LESSTQFKHVVDIAWRRKWWAIVPFVLATVASLVLVGVIPKVYRATTTILVTSQSVSHEVVRSADTLRIEERLRSLEQQIFSRSYLEPIAREFKMTRADAGEAEIAAACLKLRGQIIPELDKQNFSWFRISVDDVDPNRAAGIANQLAGTFIGKNSGIRTSQATGTLEATEGWAQRYRLEVDKRDEEISKFKKENLYELPDQQPANEQLLFHAKENVAKLTSAIQSSNDLLVRLQSQRDAERTRSLARSRDGAVGGGGDRLTTLQGELEGLLAVYTEANPLVKRKRAQIAELAGTTPPKVIAAAPEDPSATAPPDAISLQIAAVENEIASLERDRARETAQVYAYTARIGNAPRLQPKLLELTRDSDQAKLQLELAAVQNERARHLHDLEESNTGDQFQIQDLASAPTAPFKPSVFAYVLAGIGLGIALGVGAAAAREFVDQSVRSEDAFAALFPDLAVYGVIPSLDAGSKSSIRSASHNRRAEGLA